ncbi:MAG: uncharacterized protein PWQ22_1109 [Archaeoglobaceae archaeon]|nr:uncharacterized protein [Archaeoglobaceae archaeon]MDK2876699.1 uncharacterized protein [Archaeoglobaceae archaeon]
MKSYRFSYKETNVKILAENEEFYEIAVKAILEARSEIEVYAKLNPYFLISYEPIDCPNCQKKGVVINMCRSARLANVGPMASVAGAIAQFAVDRMIEAGAKIAVVENGGDIAIHSDRELKIGVYPSKIALVIPPTDRISVCTSSGKVGPSVSFGWADAVTIIAEDACVADAFATALGNSIGDLDKEELEKTVARFYSENKEFIKGAIVIKEDLIAFAGKIPRILPADFGEDLITKP